MTMDMQRRRQFKERVHVWSRRLDLDVQSLAVAVRPMARKWASCSTAGNLTFSDELLDLPPELQDYVIVHELLHLSVPNHGKLWKALMRVHLGNWAGLEHRLEQAAQPSRSGR
jgi:predicted metal-dependent hydrolase